MESPKQNGTQKYLRDKLLLNVRFWLIGLSDVLLSKHLNKSHNFLWRHHFRTLLLWRSGDISCISILALSIKIQLFLLPQPHLFLTHVRRVKFLYFEILSPPLRLFNLIRLGLRYPNFPVIQQLHLTIIRSSQNFTRTGTGLLRTSRYPIEISAGPQPASKLSLEYRGGGGGGGGGKTAREPRFSRRHQSVPVDLLAG